MLCYVAIYIIDVTIIERDMVRLGCGIIRNANIKVNLNLYEDL